MLVRKMRGSSGNMPLMGRFQLNTGRNFFPAGTVIHWDNLPREVVVSAVVDTFKIQLYRFLGHLV